MMSISHSPLQTHLTLPTHPMSISRLRHSLTTQTHHHHHNRRRLFSLISAAVRQDTTVWTPTPISLIEPAAESLFHISIDVSDAPEIASSYTRAGQYIQLKVPDSPKPSFLAIASPPSLGASRGEFQFLVKTVAGSTAEALCGLKSGDVVELTPAMGKGFDVDKISPPEKFSTVLIFATGSAISPIRSLFESGFSADKRSDVRLYYGARNLKRMAYQDRFKVWESSGVKIVPVLSQPDEGWSGETGYVQAAFCRSKNILNPLATGVVLCGQKEMAEWNYFWKLYHRAENGNNHFITGEITSVLTEVGVSTDKILKNF